MRKRTITLQTASEQMHHKGSEWITTTRRHFLPHKPGVIAYAAEATGWIVNKMDNVFMISYFIVNDESFLTYQILPSNSAYVKLIPSFSDICDLFHYEEVYYFIASPQITC